MNLSMVEIDAPRMHEIEIESGIKKNSWYNICVCDISYSTRQFGYDLSSYNLYSNVVISFAEFEIIKSSNECTKRVSNEWFPKRNYINVRYKMLKIRKK